MSEINNDTIFNAMYNEFLLHKHASMGLVLDILSIKFGGWTIAIRAKAKSVSSRIVE